MEFCENKSDVVMFEGFIDKGKGILNSLEAVYFGDAYDHNKRIAEA